MDFARKFFETVYGWITGTVLGFLAALLFSMRMPVRGPITLARASGLEKPRAIDPIFALFIAAALLIALVAATDFTREEVVKPLLDGKPGRALMILIASAFVFCMLALAQIAVLRWAIRLSRSRLRKQGRMSWRDLRRGPLKFPQETPRMRARKRALPYTIVGAMAWGGLLTTLVLAASPVALYAIVILIPDWISGWSQAVLFSAQTPFSSGTTVDWTAASFLVFAYFALTYTPLFWSTARFIYRPEMQPARVCGRAWLVMPVLAFGASVSVVTSLFGAALAYEALRGPVKPTGILLRDALCDLRAFPDIAVYLTMENASSNPAAFRPDIFQLSLTALKDPSDTSSTVNDWEPLLTAVPLTLEPATLLTRLDKGDKTVLLLIGRAPDDATLVPTLFDTSRFRCDVTRVAGTVLYYGDRLDYESVSSTRVIRPR